MGVNSGNTSVDITVRPGAACLTTTAQYCWVGGGTGSTEFTPNLINTTTSYKYPTGIVQNRMTANAVSMTIRIGGVSKVVAGGSVTAFRWLQPASIGSVVMLTAQTAATVTTASIAAGAVCGMSLENGQSTQVIEMTVAPGPIVAGPGWA